MVFALLGIASGGGDSTAILRCSSLWNWKVFLGLELRERMGDVWPFSRSKSKSEIRKAIHEAPLSEIRDVGRE